MHLFSILAKTINGESQKREAPEGNSSPGSKNHANNGCEVESAVSPGDLIWVKHHGNTWWPAQVVEENSVSEINKPGNKSKGKVLVRLYGSYEYLYADPMKCRSEFKKILEQNHGNCYDILDKALEQIRSGRKSKGKGSKSTANARADASKGKNKVKPNSPRAEKNTGRKTPQRKGSNADDKSRSKTPQQDETRKSLKRKGPSTDKQTTDQSFEQASPGESPKSARRTRVMQGLGLIAPVGSPFDKNGLV